MGIIRTVLAFLRALMAGRAPLAAENLALRHQLAVLQRSVTRSKLRKRDRIFWRWLSRLWRGWRSALVIVQPATVIQWHRQGFRLYWRRKSRQGKPGRPQADREIRDLIRRIFRENPTWGAPRILSELLLLGHAVAESTVAKYMVRQPKPPSQTWRTFLANHAGQIAAVDFFTVPTVTFRVLYVFVVLRHERHLLPRGTRTLVPGAQLAGSSARLPAGAGQGGCQGIPGRFASLLHQSGIGAIHPPYPGWPAEEPCAMPGIRP